MAIEDLVHATDSDLEAHTKRKICIGNRFEIEKSPPCTLPRPLKLHTHHKNDMHIASVSGSQTSAFSLFTQVIIYKEVEMVKNYLGDTDFR